MKKILVLALFLSSVFASSQTFSKPDDMDAGEHKHHGFMKMMKDLDLTEAQKSQIKSIKQKHQESVKQEIQAVLTAEQKTKMNKMIEEHQKEKAEKKNKKNHDED